METLGLPVGWILKISIRYLANTRRKNSKSTALLCVTGTMKGLVRKDGATLKDAAPDRKAGRIKLEFLGSYPDTLDAHENSSSNLDA